MLTDDEFLRDFEAQRPLPEEWHHREHIRLAYLYLRRFPFDQAAARVRDGIRALNAAHGVVDTPTRGYHETMTIAWLRLVEFVLAEYGPEESGEAFCDAHPELLEKKALRLFYSRGRLMSLRAKGEFLAPDMTALPRSPGSAGSYLPA